ncbi:hypothetical protein [Phreatobacter stygius]|uniref:Uncharacterized protein n=1 Tax=Phreatobacter stygius TaxID=1940610 RepID=A0A4D7AYW4_9HYPH|nr:hypothetical protein [Phreatobacter stygius]QCI62870.1 hypothetical protein E8M01_00585 [Phreatobacter stygius]
MIPIINGYACVTSEDAALARHGFDPQNPTNDPAKAEELAASVGRAVMPEEAFDALIAHPEAAVEEVRANAGPKPSTGPGRIFDFKA